MRKWILSTAIVLMVLGVKSQASLGFSSFAVPGLADTLIKNSNITYGVTVMNTGNQPLAVSYTVYTAVLDSSLMLPDIVDSVNVPNNAFQPGDTSQVTFTHNVDPLKFMDGNNTVVIWPAANGYQTTDTIFKNVFVLNFENIDELAINQLTVFPNPVTDYLVIRAETELENVRILDLNGKEIFCTNQRVIDFSSFESGLYIIEVKTTDEKFLRKKVLVK